MHFLYAHFIGDYIIQNDWMALKKKSSSLACMIHVLTYILPFLLLGLQWWQYALIAIQHFLQDRWNFVIWFMKVTGHENFAKPPCAPWSIFLTDNIIHVIFMLVVIEGVRW